MPASLTVVSIKLLAIPTATQITANGINDHGQVVGQFVDKNGEDHGFIWEADSFSQVDYPGMTAVNLYKINNLGQFVGSMTDPNGTVHGFFFDRGTLSPPLTYPGAGATYALGINDRGEIAGTYYAAAQSRGFLFKAGRFHAPNLPSAQQTAFQAINNSGQVAGITVDPQGTHGVLYLENLGLFTPQFDFPGATVTYPQAVNGGGQLGGQYTNPNGNGQAFVSLAGSLLTVTIPGAVSASILGINDRGQVCGNFIDANQVHHAYIAVLPI
jgi:probable HAF family extracellular repeat protein